MSTICGHQETGTSTVNFLLIDSVFLCLAPTQRCTGLPYIWFVWKFFKNHTALWNFNLRHIVELYAITKNRLLRLMLCHISDPNESWLVLHFIVPTSSFLSDCFIILPPHSFWHVHFPVQQRRCVKISLEMEPEPSEWAKRKLKADYCSRRSSHYL